MVEIATIQAHSLDLGQVSDICRHATREERGERSFAGTIEISRYRTMVCLSVETISIRLVVRGIFQVLRGVTCTQSGQRPFSFRSHKVDIFITLYHYHNVTVNVMRKSGRTCLGVMSVSPISVCALLYMALIN